MGNTIINKITLEEGEIKSEITKGKNSQEVVKGIRNKKNSFITDKIIRKLKKNSRR